MSDVKSMLDALECHFKPIGEENCSECAYECRTASWTKIQDDLAKDILELLKKQQPVEPKRYGASWFCGSCKTKLIFTSSNKAAYCWRCGRGVKWYG